MNPFNEANRHTKIIQLDALIQRGTLASSLKSGYMDANTLNLEPDQTIYRIFDWDKLKKTLSNKNLCLVRPKLWDDPFENFLLKSQGVYNGQYVGFDKLRENYYGQCWTLREECDGLWRNYKGTSTSAFKVKSSVGKLMDYFYDMTNKFHELSYYVGKVEYVPNQTIASFFQNELDILHSSSGLPFVQSLLIKREAFSYEEELRLIFQKSSSDELDMNQIANKWDDTDLFFVSIDPNVLFDEIQLDPWLKETDAQKLENDIRILGYTGNITRSSLYNEPFFQARIK